MLVIFIICYVIFIYYVINYHIFITSFFSLPTFQRASNGLLAGGLYIYYQLHL